MHSLPPPSETGGAGAPVWFLRGAVAALSVPGCVLVATFIGFGGLLHDVQFPLVAGLLSTLLIWALPAQVILVGGLAAGSPIPALAIAVCLSGVRLLPMVVSVMPMMRGTRPRLWQELLCAHFVAVTLWVEGVRLLPGVPQYARPAYSLGIGSGLMVLSLSGTAIGFYLTDALPGPLAISLLLLTPISFTILLVRNARAPADWLAIGFGATISPLATYLPGGLDLFWAGVGGGTLAFIVARWLPRRRA
ncbi:AzlC family ABC transporter permease [Ancylobacter pratisalsi]|uniref:AzlC family ABC transporter permease n=1 Tax=Ancylobacter pratisalsi TaxID=1745854 RepID=A0A6P1YG88_9HYPH|nr:AzlC family ABC transporter permease [Ancylobacter pratisalsi]QIB32328.1 AzlC family ABC transporter permease [Ancylobacter pratisalsi]